MTVAEQMIWALNVPINSRSCNFEYNIIIDLVTVWHKRDGIPSKPGQHVGKVLRCHELKNTFAKFSLLYLEQMLLYKEQWVRWPM